jgi:hypothetical protein
VDRVRNSRLESEAQKLTKTRTPATALTDYVAIDSSRQLIVVSFRGSENLPNFFNDALFQFTDASSLCSGCQAFYGFWAAWMEGRSAVMDAVKQPYASNPNYKVLLSGHSLGAAVATLATADFRQAGFTVDMVYPAFYI